jgi:predicted DNA binding CopG/RHH family protein
MVMAGKKTTIPKFRSEKEEAQWWDAHPEVATRLLKRALKQGTVQRRPGETRIVTMRIPVRDLDAAQQLAERKGLPYQTYMKMLLHQALEKERVAG